MGWTIPPLATLAQHVIVPGGLGDLFLSISLTFAVLKAEQQSLTRSVMPSRRPSSS
jgi:hypothetical protein